MLNHPKIIYKVRDIRERTIQYLVGAGSLRSLRSIEQSQKPARSSRDLHSHFTNKFAVHLFGWLGGGGFRKLLIFVIYGWRTRPYKNHG